MNVTEQAVSLDVEYLSPEWYAARRNGIAGSEIAAVLGISPWVSRFDLWWSKQTGDDSQADTKGMLRGRRYEALVLEDFTVDHPEFRLSSPGLVANIERPWQMATVDALAHEGGGDEPLAVVEAKTAGSRNEWGDPGTDDIPVYYRAQALWQMDTLGLNIAYIPVLFGAQYAEYIVEFDEGDVKLMRDAAEEFLASVRDNQVPDLDDHQGTTRRLKRLHPAIEEGEVEIPAYVLREYHAAKRLRDAAEARMRLNENRLRALLGPHNVATVNGRKVASRSVYDVRERVQTVRGFTVNKLTFTKPREERAS